MLRVTYTTFLTDDYVTTTKTPMSQNVTLGGVVAWGEHLKPGGTLNRGILECKKVDQNR